MNEPQAPGPTTPPKRRWPLSTMWTVILGIVTLGWVPLAAFAVYLWRGGDKTAAKWVGGVASALALVVVIAIASGGNGSKPAGETAAPEAATTQAATPVTETKPAAPPGDNMNYRTRQFLKQLHGCQAGVAILSGELKHAAERDLVTLSDETHSVKEICDNVRHNMVALDTEHFDDQALTAEIAVDEYKKGLDDLSDFIDTATPSKAVGAKDHFQTASSYAAEAVRTINERRAVYGLPPLPE
jgi:hypothetical protein